MDEILESVKDNARELKYLRDECVVVERRLDKNDQCHNDLKDRMGRFELKMNTIEGEVAPMKKIMWIVLTLLITTVGGAILALVIIR